MGGSLIGERPTVKPVVVSTGLGKTSGNDVILSTAISQFDIDCRCLFGGGFLHCTVKIDNFAKQYRNLKNYEDRSRVLLGLLLYKMAYSPKCIFLNASSIVSKHKRHYLNLFLTEHKPDILLLAEHRLSPRNRLNINVYTIFRQNQQGERGGCTAAFVRDILKLNMCNLCKFALPQMKCICTSI